MKKLLGPVLLLLGVSGTLPALAISTFVSEDLACISAGLLIAAGRLDWFAGTLACFAGIFLGDIWLFLMGRYLGRPALSRWPLRSLVSAEDVRRAEELFKRRGPSLVFASRFLPGSRLPVYFASGVVRANFWWFTGYFALACAVWTPLLVGASALLQKQFASAFGRFAQSTGLLMTLAALTYFALWLIRKALTYRSRRLLVSLWRRWTRWEFWPMWLFYPPIVLYILWLAIKHRSLTVFALANPEMPGGGFAGESKSAILRALSRARDYVAPHFVVEEAGTAQAALREIESRGWNFPVALKPDAGERGSGVAIAKSPVELRNYFESAIGPIIVQKYVPGYEFGVFYVRRPQEENGFIFAITDKRFPSVTGDGEKELERLILEDDRAVCMAAFHMERHRASLKRIPAAGENVRLVELGTHCRGSLFLEGIHLKTEALERKIDWISKCYDGFYFGRYDIRTPSIEDFQQGRNFQVVELNGVTSEATSIYDPSHGLLHAYRVLMQQWRIAFEIGAANRALGYTSPAVRELLSSVRKDSGIRSTNRMKLEPEERHHVPDTQTARI